METILRRLMAISPRARHGFGAILAATFWGLSPSAQAQDCIDYGATIEPVNFLAGFGLDRVKHIEFHDDIAYVADGQRLTLLDVSDPRQLRSLGGDFGSGAYQSAVIAPQRVLVAAGSNIRTLDVTDPNNIPFVATLAMPGRAAFHFVRSGAYFFVGDGASGIHVVHAPTPDALAIVRSVATMGAVRDLDGTPETLYVLSDELQIFDIRNPLEPQLVGNLPIDASHIALENDLLVAQRRDEIVVIDIANPAQPRLLSSYTVGSALGVSIYQAQAYVTTYTRGVRAVDLSDPMAPQEVGRLPYPRASFHCIHDTFTYVSDTQGLTVLRVAEIRQVEPLADIGSFGRTEAIVMEEDLGYMGGDEFRILDFQNPTEPVVLGSLALASTLVHVQLPHAYLILRDGSIAVVDVSQPRDPAQVGGFETPGHAQDIAVRGNHVLVADRDEGVVIFDATDLQNIHVVRQVLTAGWAERIVAVNDHAFVTDRVVGLAVLNIDVPELARLVTNFPMDIPWRLSASDGVLYAGLYRDLETIDISRPEAPVRLGRITLPGANLFTMGDLQVRGTRALISSYDNGLWILDVADATNPRTVGFWAPTTASVQSATFAGGAVIVRDGFRLKVLPEPCSTPVPIEVSDLLASGSPEGIRLSWRTEDPGEWSTFLVWRREQEASNNSFEQLAGNASMSNHAWEYVDASAVAGASYEYLIEGVTQQGSRRIVGRVTATSPLLAGGLRIWPNPANGGTSIQFTPSSAGELRVEVFNAAGRRIRQLHHGHVPSAAIALWWDGTDSHGIRVGAGVYFIKLSAPNQRSTHRVTILR